jgi:hypothetical protein
MTFNVTVSALPVKIEINIFLGFGFPAVLFARGFESQLLDRDQTVHI